MTDEKRPLWLHNEMSLLDFTELHDFGMVVSVKAGWEYKTADTTAGWLEAKNTHGKTMRMPTNWHKVCSFVGCYSSPGLFEWNYTGERMRKSLAEIRKFAAVHEEEMAEYIRLKSKFEG